jgi:hypothetical protein
MVSAWGYVLALLLSAGIAAAFAAYGLAHRREPGVDWFVSLMALPAGWTLLCRDVTTVEQHHQRLQMLQRLLRHNLRNELHVVEGQARVIESRVPEVSQRQVTPIGESAQDLLSIAEKMRRIEELAPGSEPDPVDTNLGTVLEAVADTVRTDSPDAELSLSVPEGVRIRTEPEVLEDVVAELDRTRRPDGPHRRRGSRRPDRDRDRRRRRGDPRTGQAGDPRRPGAGTAPRQRRRSLALEWGRDGSTAHSRSSLTTTRARWSRSAFRRGVPALSTDRPAFVTETTAHPTPFVDDRRTDSDIHKRASPLSRYRLQTDLRPEIVDGRTGWTRGIYIRGKTIFGRYGTNANRENSR